MSSSQMNFLVARTRVADLRERAQRRARVDAGYTPVTGVTLRYANAGDAERLRRLAELDTGIAPAGAALVAEVDGRLRAALPLDGGRALADPFYRGAELVDLLRLRARQLGVATTA